jgi:hypothetical protein
VQAAADDLNVALAAQPHGGTAATAEKNNKKEALVVLLRKLKHYVEDNCENDPAVLLSSGFQAAASTCNRSPLANPDILITWIHKYGNHNDVEWCLAKNRKGQWLPYLWTSVLSVNFGNSTELVLKVTPIARAKCYKVRSATVGAGNAPGLWQTAGLFTNSKSMTIAALVPGTTYAFRVRAVGGSTGYSDWSNLVSRMCV